MKRDEWRRAAVVLSIIVAVPAVGGCAGVQPPSAPLRMSVHTVQYPQAEKYPFKVSLELSKELQNATWNVEYLAGQARTVPLGMQLAHNAKGLARHLLASVVITQETASAPVERGGPALIPRLAYTQHVPQPLFTASSGRPPALVIALEWTLKSANGATIWTETVRAELNEPFPSVRTTGANPWTCCLRNG
jgi:hypothetical protein